MWRSMLALSRQTVLAFLAVVVILLVAALLAAITRDPNFGGGRAAAGAVDGLTIFAVFFVAAQGLERLLEPISAVLLPKGPVVDNLATAMDDAEKKVAAWSQAIRESEAGGTAAVDQARQAAQHALDEAAKAKADLDARHQDRVIVYWALATILAMVASATLRLYFLRVVGMSGASRGLEILATGLIIGAGTKPLHDLVTQIQAKKEQAAAATTQA